MEPFTLRLTFGGLCAFAPKADGSQLLIFLPDASEAELDVNRPGLEGHHAFLSTSMAHVKSEEVKCDDGKLLWRLSGVHLDLTSADPNPLPLNIAGYPLPVGQQEPTLTMPPADTDTSFWWIASLERACLGRKFLPGGGALQPKFISDKMRENYGLAARISLSSGELSVKNFLVMSQAYIVWRFRSSSGKESNGDHRQVLAADIILQQKIMADRVTFRARPLTSTTTSESLSLFPVRDSVTGELVVDVVIRNEESAQYFPNPLNQPPKIKQARKRDRLFERFYELVKNPPSFGDAPIPVSDYLVGSTGGGGAQSAPPCSPSRLEPF